MKNLRHRNFLTLLDFTKQEVEFLLNLSEDLKKAKYAGIEQKRLNGKNIALIFEKDSTRTRCAFEVAAYDQGARVTYLGPTGSQMGKKETAKDTARVLGGMYDGIEYRGFSQATVETLAEFAGVPVWNGLTDADHPTQVLADFLTAKECLHKPYQDIRFTYVGDGRNNVANALMIGASIVGMTFHLVCPDALRPEKALLEKCQSLAQASGATIDITSDIEKGVRDSDVLYTDVWVSMGEPDDVWKERISLLEPYRVTQKMIEMTNNPNVIFEHCLPSFHNIDTKIGKEIFDKYGFKEMEVSDEVFEGPHSVVFQEAENRMHTIKAVMVATLGD
ncbi:ornithine carbamoyltransferase [Streptococcus halichoeri]|uniref:ornithine carbamoyltransferase n=1 Tax=Streptococcus halichoeri TaxID=254785 RepID=UPI00135A9684|nr:ornithine carbamoyltransferase [Streptococcus halichoeri]